MVEKKSPKNRSDLKKSKKTELPKAEKVTKEKKKAPASFWARKITKPSKPESKELPIWVMMVFVFSLAFFLFSLYKVYIFNAMISERPEQFQEQETIIEDRAPLREETELLESIEVHPELVPENAVLPDTAPETVPEASEGGAIQEEAPARDISASLFGTERKVADDIQDIKVFYQHLIAGDIKSLNEMVDAGLKNTEVWKKFWNKKNLKIFSKNLASDFLVDNLFLIPGSLNEEKKSREYSYTLKYTIQPEREFVEEWKMLLRTVGENNYIALIKCENTGCSRSPFFWPQNYNLK